MRPQVRWTAVVAVVAGAMLLSTACTPGGGQPTDSAKETGQATVTDPGQMGNLTLTVWDGQTQGAEDEVMNALNGAFEEKYPNITIKRVSRSFEDLRTALRLAITDKTGPDVVQPNKGRPDMGAFVQAGLLRPLDEYADKYGWDERFPASILNWSRWSSDAKDWGEGSLYGVPQLDEVVGIYYNEADLHALGLEPPQTWEEFEAQLVTIKDAGEIPIQFGNLEQWPAIHEYGLIQSRYEPAETIRKLGFGTEGADYQSDGNLKAATILQDWATSGFFAPGYNGQTYDDSSRLYRQGEGVFFIAGTWLLTDFVEALGDDVGFMLPPPSQAGQPIVAPGGPDLSFSVTANSENPDAAAAYIDFITNDDAMSQLAKAGVLPINNLGSAVPSSGAVRQAHDALEAITDADGMVPYLDYGTPTMYDTITVALQDLLAKRVTPEDFTARLQKDYADFTLTGTG